MRYLITKTIFKSNTTFYAILEDDKMLYYDFVKIKELDALADFLKSAADNYSVDTILIQNNGLGLAICDFLKGRDNRVKEVHYTNALRDREEVDYAPYNPFSFEKEAGHYFNDLIYLYMNFLGQNFTDVFTQKLNPIEE